MAEGRLKEICSAWNIYRFSPVYTEDVKRDIQKRYYLKYPDWAYLIGGGQQFEVLNVLSAVAAMVDWVDRPVDNTIHIIKDNELLDSAKVIAEERAEGRAKHVLRLPRWMVVCGYGLVRLVFGKSNKTYLELPDNACCRQSRYHDCWRSSSGTPRHRRYTNRAMLHQ